MRWISIAEEGQPIITKENPYPTHLVRLALKDSEQNWESIKKGELRLFGGDRNRPYWFCPEKSAPLENDAWVVTHYLSHSLDTIEGWPK